MRWYLRWMWLGRNGPQHVVVCEGVKWRAAVEHGWMSTTWLHACRQ